MLDELVAGVTPELAEAVAIALALDPRDRYQNAREMGRALSDGLNGIPPAKRTEASGHAPATQATRLLASAPGAASTPPRGNAASAVTPRRPRPGPPRSSGEPVARAPSSSAGNHRRANRLLVTLVLLLLVAMVVVAVVLITTPSQTKVVIHQVIYSEVPRPASALRQLVSENTK